MSRQNWSSAQGAGKNTMIGVYQTHGQSSRQVAVRDMPAHTKLKFRTTGQSAPEDLETRDFRKELEEREKEHLEKSKEKLLGIAAPEQQNLLADVSKDDEAAFDDSDDDVSTDSDSSSSDSDDDEIELIRELERIKAEREAERKKAEEKAKEEEQKRLEDEALSGNPLLAPKATSTIKRRWDEDALFRNQSRLEPKKKKRFINDTIRNEFHVKFMQKYVK
eukprot:TRINITY_DN781998_c0_g1_i1.p1 TRINITY_DN781998_c0_g1~~TRINITY_DN781998_c0_g1_i1.p1  ORF type:complete len:220 (+),score=82.12 TRINITY_DN781998_c0_g1_i1:59-718(+)